MNTHDRWLARLMKLNKARNNAPHKPLLLLSIIEMADRGILTSQAQKLTPEIAFIFDTYATVVIHRRTQRPDIRMPFHHLSTQGFWIPYTASCERSSHRSQTTHIEIDPEFFALCHDDIFRMRARQILIATHFEPAERNSLYNLIGVEVPREDEIARCAMFRVEGDAAQVGREGRFRINVVGAYHYSCALTGYRVSTVNGGTIVDAAHIHKFAESGNNDCRNGLALCKNAHWLFDLGLWSIDDAYCILVAVEQFDEESPDQNSLVSYIGKRLRLPKNEAAWPDKTFMKWHRSNCFLG